jgi:hypothetical protein
MTAWRWPSRDEQHAHFRALLRILEPRIAAAIAPLPLVVLDPEAAAPWALRADAWCHRVDRLLKNARR